MKSSPRPDNEASTTTNRPRTRKSASLLLLATALDTTWRLFIPLLGATFLGIGLDHAFNSVPIATIACLAAGTALSAFLVMKQIRNVRKSL